MCAFYSVNEAEHVSWEIFSGENLVFRTVRNYKNKKWKCGYVCEYCSLFLCSCKYSLYVLVSFDAYVRSAVPSS